MVFVLLAVGFICSALVTAAAIPLVRSISHRRGWVDKPDGKRKLHAEPTATAGGLAIAVGFLAGLVYVYSIRDLLPFSVTIPSAALFIGGVAMLLTGFYDDVRGLGFKHKFFAQVAVALLLIQAGFRIDPSVLTFIDFDPYNQTLYSITLTVLWIVGVMNAVNLVDGLDGLAGGIALIAFASLGLAFALQGGVVLMILALLISGALAAFLVFNFNPASIFMGDSGSLFLGFLLAAYSLQGPSHADPLLAMLVPVVVLGFPVADTSLSIIRRLVKRQAVCSPDQDHIHHRLLRRFSTRQAVLILYVVAGCFGTVAVLMTLSPAPLGLVLFAAVFLVAAVAIRMLGYEPLNDLRLLYTQPSLMEVKVAATDVADGAPVEEYLNGDGEQSTPSMVEEESTGDGMPNVNLPLLSFSSLFKHPRIMISKDAVVTLERDVTAAHLDGEAVLLNLKTGNYFSVNEVGTSIVELIQEPKPVGQIIDTLLGEYAVPPDQLENDVLSFLQKMEEQRLVGLATDHAGY